MPRTTPVRVVVADRRTMLRSAAANVLSADDRLKLIGCESDLDSVFALIDAHAAEVLVIDLHMFGNASRERVAEIRRRRPGTAVVILTMDATPAFVPALLAAGASAYVLKEFSETDLVPAVLRAAEGASFVSAALVS